MIRAVFRKGKREQIAADVPAIYLKRYNKKTKKSTFSKSFFLI